MLWLVHAVHLHHLWCERMRGGDSVCVKGYMYDRMDERI